MINLRSVLILCETGSCSLHCKSSMCLTVDPCYQRTVVCVALTNLFILGKVEALVSKYLSCNLIQFSKHALGHMP